MNMSYTKDCDNCKEKILMQQVNGKWGAYDPSGTGWHKCSKSKNGGRQQAEEENARAFVREVMQGPTLEQRITRLEKMMNLLLTTGSWMYAYKTHDFCRLCGLWFIKSNNNNNIYVFSVIIEWPSMLEGTRRRKVN
jgi:hypothetical protein